MSWIGIDYGSKLAGTTVVCYLEDGLLKLEQSKKKEDADEFLKQLINRVEPQKVFIDAPLSLPGAYHGKSEDFFYRKCDRETKAMSPMFLGGLTARAMRLASQIPTVAFYETYPGYFIRNVLDFKVLYTKKLPYNNQLAEKLIEAYSLKLSELPQNWHQLDALACWISGWRQDNGKVIVIGDKAEGAIYL